MSHLSNALHDLAKYKKDMDLSKQAIPGCDYNGDPIEIDDVVRPQLRNKRCVVLKLKDDKSSALITWDDDWTWWPCKELIILSKGQGELF